MADDSEQPFKIDGSKVWLSVTAREWARQYGMSDVEFAKYLMNRQRLGEDYQPGETDDAEISG